MREKKVGKKELQTCQIREQSATKVLLFRKKNYVHRLFWNKIARLIP